MVAAGSIYFGPEPDNSRYYSCPMGSAVAGDMCIVMTVKVPRLFTGVVGQDPNIGPGSAMSSRNDFAQSAGFTSGNGGGGNDSFFGITASNTNPSTSGRKLTARLATAGVTFVTGGAALVGSTQFGLGDTFVMVLQSNAGTWQLKSCLRGSGTVVTEATATRNAGFTTSALQNWYVGLNTASQIQDLHYAAQVLTDADIVSLAAGGDIDTIVSTVGNRKAGWFFDTPAASITAHWGASAATRVGTFTLVPTSSPVVPNASSRIEVTNEPVPYGAVSCADNGTNGIKTWTGTYTGYTPAGLEARVEDQTGTTVVNWTALGSFTASAGVWSGTLSIPPGGLYRIQVRDTATPSIIWRGAQPWSCCPIIASMGQSPMAYFETQFKSIVTPPSNLYVAYASTISGLTEIIPATSGRVGAGLAMMGNRWSTVSGGLPLVYAETAVVGSSSDMWAAKGSTTWTPFLAMLDQIRADRVFLPWLNGASDGGSSAATIKANHDTIYANLGTDLTTARGIAFRYAMVLHNRDTNNTLSNTRIRAAQFQWARDKGAANVLEGPQWLDMQTDAESLGTAQAGTATTITLAASDVSVSGYAGIATVEITGGPGVGQSKLITAYNSTTKVATVSTWTTNPTSASTYRITGASPHPNYLGGVDRFADRYGQAIAYAYGKSATNGRGPTVASATYPNGGDGSIIDVKFTHRHGAALRTPNGSTAATGVAGFAVSENAFVGTKTITSAVITSATTVRLTLSAAPTTKANLLVRYGDAAPVLTTDWYKTGFGLGDLLYDDTGIGVTSGLPAEFTPDDIAVTQAPAVPSLVAVGGTLAAATGGTLTVV